MLNYKKGLKRLGLVCLVVYWIAITIVLISEAINAPEYRTMSLSPSGMTSYSGSRERYMFTTYEASEADRSDLEQNYQDCLTTTLDTEKFSKESLCHMYTTEEYRFKKTIPTEAVVVWYLLVPIVSAIALFILFHILKALSKVMFWIRDGFVK